MTPQSLTPEAIAPNVNPIPEIDYPDTDGNPMSDNTEQYRWIVMIKENLEIIFANNPNVFIAGDLLWYPVRYTPKRMAPDVMAVFGRPKGRRGSYRQWEEDNIAPQVAFEILSPSNKDRRGLESLEDKFNFYETYGIEEYYVYDPDDLVLDGWIIKSDRFVKIEPIHNWISPKLGIHFEWLPDQELVLYRPDGQRFLSSVELAQQVEQERLIAQQERQRADRLAELLRSLGVDPDQQ